MRFKSARLKPFVSEGSQPPSGQGKIGHEAAADNDVVDEGFVA